LSSVDDHDREELTEEQEEGSRTVRIAVRVALAVAALVVAYVLLFGGSEYTITAEFQNAAQLVPGSQVVVAGVPTGSVKSIALGDHGQALVTFSVSDPYAPLREGTTATIRSYSLSGIANRQVQLNLPPADKAGQELPSGATLPESQTVSEVDLDQLFNTLNAKTVENFKHVIQGFELSYEGVSQQANTGYKYLNPFLSTSRQVFGELTRDTPALESLIVDTSHLSGALAQRSSDISGLIHNVDLMMGAIARQSDSLKQALVRFPGFMRQANTTFVNLRATLDDLTPLVNASKPVAEKLPAFFHQFRLAAHGAVPTITDLDQTIQRPGPQNDLVELTRDAIPLAHAAIGSGSPDCGKNPSSDYSHAADQNFTQGAFGESVCSLRNGLPNLASFRAYTPELVSWFNDFGTSGIQDANGGIARIETTFNAFSAGLPHGLTDPTSPIVDISGFGGTHKKARCPGANERNPGDNSTPFTDNGTLACDPSQVPLGP
jgi:phospholipid/cholesterol/gamma-HCH transport system substrate-binding protein